MCNQNIELWLKEQGRVKIDINMRGKRDSVERGGGGGHEKSSAQSAQTEERRSPAEHLF